MVGEFVIFSKRVAYALHDKGFRWLRKEPSLKNEGLDVFIFADTPEFKRTLNSILKG